MWLNTKNRNLHEIDKHSFSVLGKIKCRPIKMELSNHYKTNHLFLKIVTNLKAQGSQLPYFSAEKENKIIHLKLAKQKEGCTSFIRGNKRHNNNDLYKINDLVEKDDSNNSFQRGRSFTN